MSYNNVINCTFHFYYNNNCDYVIKCGAISSSIQPYQLIEVIQESNNNTLNNLRKVTIIQHITKNCNPIKWIIDGINSELLFQDGKAVPGV